MKGLSVKEYTIESAHLQLSSRIPLIKQYICLGIYKICPFAAVQEDPFNVAYFCSEITPADPTNHSLYKCIYFVFLNVNNSFVSQFVQYKYSLTHNGLRHVSFL